MNLVSLNAEFSQLSARISKSNTEASRSISRLSSGNRITRAGDDVANLSVSTKLLSRTTALRSTLTNLSQASTLLQVAEGGMQQVEGLLQRMNQLSVMANSGTVSGRERAYLDVEFQNMKGEIDRIANTTNFNGVSLLNGIGNTSLETLSATFDTTYNGGTDSDNLTGTAGNERFFAGDGDDAIQGGGGNDFINAGLGNDYIDGGDGNDTITAAAELQNSSLTLPFTNGLVMQMDAANTASITTSPGVVGTIQDQSTNNNDIFNDTGAVVSGSSTIGTENSLSFDGTSFLQVNDSANINLAAQNQRSVMITFETGADITTRQLLYEQGGQTNGFNIYIDNGNLYVGAWKSNGGAFNIHLSTAIQADTSYATGFVFDFSGAGNFRGYLNGAQFGSAAVGQNQAGHSGDIGIGGKNNDTRYFDGGSGGDGNAFIGEIGEVINYSGGLSTIEVDQVMDYLMSKWGIGAVNSGDEVVGGLGQDELIITGGTYNAALDADALIREIETITLSGNNNGHAIDVKDEYYTLGEGLENKTLVIDASGNTAGISVDAEQLSAENILTVIGSEGADTVTGGGEGNVTFSYAGATGGVEVDLVTGEATGSGQDVLTGVNGLIGGNYDDTITGSYGNDTISGGAGDDIITDIGPTEGKLVSEGLVSYIDASSTGNITTHPGNVTLITDNGGTGNNAQNDTGAVLSGTDTINGVNSLTFDGASFLRIPNSNDINNNGQAQRSIYMTFETSDDVTTRQVLYEEGGGTNGFSIYIDQGQVYVAAWQGGGGTFNYLLSTEIEENTAYDVGFVFDSSVTQTFTGYLNKEQFGQLNANVAQLSHSGEIGIGASHGGTYFTDTGGVAGDGYIFRGEIGELLIYDTALTDAQNEQLQNYLIARRVGYFGGNDVLNGGDGNDTITGGLGNDTIDGGTGIDTAVFSGKRSNYSIQKISEGVYRVTDKTAGQNDGSDLIRDVERLQFSDGTLTLKRFDIAEENVTFQVREESEQYIEIVLPNVTVEHLFADVNVNILTQDAAEAAFNAVRLALNVVTAERAKTGALQSSVDTLHSANSEAIREQMAARAATSDTNIAVTSTEFASQLVQNEMSTSIAAQANTLRSDLVLAILEDGITLSA